MYKKVSGSVVMFLVLYLDDILTIETMSRFYNLSKFGYPRISP